MKIKITFILNQNFVIMIHTQPHGIKIVLPLFILLQLSNTIWGQTINKDSLFNHFLHKDIKISQVIIGNWQIHITKRLF